MAKDDMHVIIYKLLSYLYECMKKDKAVDEELLTNTTFLLEWYAENGISFNYTAINLGHANYKIIKKEIIQGIKENSMVDDIMDEIFGEEWRTWE